MKKLLPVVALLALACLPASAYTSYKTVSFGAGQTGQAVTYAVESGTGTVVTVGVSGSVVELGGGAYGAAITVPDGANYFVVWSETNGGTTYTASDRIEAQAQAALPTLTGQTTVLTQVAKIGTSAGDSPGAQSAQAQASATAAIVAKFLFDSSSFVKSATQTLPSPAPLGYGGGAALDPWGTPLPAFYPVGSAGWWLGHGQVRVVTPVSPGDAQNRINQTNAQGPAHP